MGHRIGHRRTQTCHAARGARVTCTSSRAVGAVRGSHTRLMLGSVTRGRHVESPSRALAVTKPVLVLVAVMWLVEVVDVVLPMTLERWGIIGRSANGAVGVLAAPFLHAGFGHLMANTLPLLVLGMMVSWRATDRFCW